jgi:hypothetical protein
MPMRGGAVGSESTQRHLLPITGFATHPRANRPRSPSNGRTLGDHLRAASPRSSRRLSSRDVDQTGGRPISGPDVGLQLQKLNSRQLPAGVPLIQDGRRVPARGAVELSMCAIGVSPVACAGEHQEDEAHPQNPAPAEIVSAIVKVVHDRSSARQR